MKSGEVTASPSRHSGRSRPLKQKFCEMPFTGAGIRDVLRYLELRTINDPFSYIVTPNVDHVVRNWREKGKLVEIYEDAELSLCDSRIVSLIGRFSGIALPVVTGSDLTSILLDYTIDPAERITIIGGSTTVIAKLAGRYGLRDVRHFNPPMGFIRDPAAVLEAAQFVEQNPSRFVFFAVGSPQQEILARSIKQRGQAVGVGLCVGASLLFLTGDLQRAPVWMQRARLEWLHRLAQEPRRMWRRYLYDAPKILRIAADHKREQRILVSVIVPTAHHEELLPPLIERCDAQTGFNAGAVELIVVDRSTEGSARMIVERQAGKARTIVRYLHARDSGIARARDLGVREAQGEFVAFVRDRALPSPSWLEAMLKVQRIYDPDVVLGPVEAMFSSEPVRHAESYRRSFSLSSDATTGTAVEARRPMQFTGGGAFVPFDLANAMMFKANYGSGRDSARPGPDSGEDALFFQRMLQDGKRLIWCAEAAVQEQIPADMLTPRILLRRAFRRSQLTAATALAPPVHMGDIAAWLAIGMLQILVGGFKALAWPVNRDLGVRGAGMVAAGLGKLALWGGRDRFYPAATIIEAPPPPAADPAPPREPILLEPLDRTSPRRQRWWRRRSAEAV